MNVAIRQWVVVKYDDYRYPGEVTSVDDDSGNFWKWPKTEDKIF